MRINSRAGTQYASFDGSEAGEGLAIFFSQSATDVGRYRFVVKAINSQQTMQVGIFYSSPPVATTPNGGLTRMLAGAVCPGVESWCVEITCMNTDEASDETADVTLLSSKCCTSPVGVTRAAERYFYNAGDATGGVATINNAPGRVVKSWSAIAGGTAGSVVISNVDSGNTITVPANTSVQAEPGVQFLDNMLGTLFTFNNVAFFVEFLESA